ncbi:MAG: UDP-N-acetylmuramoyl-tripeptide--D-alanyl-D-alanine ligase [Planctomycetes bacterium]|nr:UDP-N-acetylmuramoyl-tripeptide--D-alanyl-D-alanine ligase [Planctomycetota bacterium]
MEPISLKEIAQSLGSVVTPTEAGERIIKTISTDSRTLDDGALFVPLRGENFDGHEYIAQAWKRGASACLTEYGIPQEVADTGPCIQVASTQNAYLDLARYYRSQRNPIVVGITGSNGKTTTKDLMGWVFQKAGPTIYSERSFNNFVGLPTTIFRIEDATRYAVLELGTNRPGEIARLTEVAAPEIGVVTNISISHLEGLKSLEGITREKASLLRGLQGRKISVLNRDDPSFDVLAESAPGKVVSFGICHRADYNAIQIEVRLDGVRFEVAGMKVQLPLLGVHSIYNALAVFACAAEVEMPLRQVVEAFKEFEGPPMRLKPMRKGSLMVFNDTYNANPGSMESAIKTFSVLPAEGRKIVVLGDMLELGEQSGSLHKKVGKHLSCGNFDLVVGVGDKATDYLVGAKQHGVPSKNLISFPNTDDALSSLPGLLAPMDSVLVKGSRKMGLERIVDAVLESEL